MLPCQKYIPISMEAGNHIIVFVGEIIEVRDER